MTEQNKLIHVGYTNQHQVGYAKDDEGAFYPDTDNDCYIPLYMLDVHLHRLGPDSEKHDYVRELEEKNKQQAARIDELEEKLKATKNKNKEGMNDFIDLMDHATKAPTAEQGILLLAGTVQKLRAAQPPQGESK